MSDKVHKRKINLLLGVTGSVATIKLYELIDGLCKKLINVNICVIPTKNSLNFIPDFDEKLISKNTSLTDRLNLLKINDNTDPLVFSFIDEDEWASWKKRSDPVLHIELRKWADLVLIAPLDANTLAKISNGLCDNLLTSVLRAWDIENIKCKPVIICPAMNTCMYKHPITKIQLNLLVEQFGFILIDSIEKILMCGDTGVGAMAKVDDIIESIYQIVKKINF